MKVSEAKFTRRYNVGNYEHEEYTLVGIVEDDEVAAEVLCQLKAAVSMAHSGDVTTTTSAAEDDDAAEVAPAPKRAKKPKAVKEEPEEEVEEDEEIEDEPADTAAEDEEEVEEEEEPPKKAPAKKKPEATAGTGATKKFKKKPQVYQRANDTHKDLFSGILRTVAPDWKKTAESKDKAKKTSLKMEGVDFLDEAGEVFPSFKELVRKSMKGK